MKNLINIFNKKHSPRLRSNRLERIVSLQKGGSKKMETKEKTYAVKLSCVNCYTKFEIQFPKGLQAEEKGFGAYHFIRKPDSQYDNIRCPNCGCSNIVKVRPY
jgi:DNA-directed RNA polymerase subunit RPC12/RpoP